MVHVTRVTLISFVTASLCEHLLLESMNLVYGTLLTQPSNYVDVWFLSQIDTRN